MRLLLQEGTKKKTPQKTVLQPGRALRCCCCCCGCFWKHSSRACVCRHDGDVSWHLPTCGESPGSKTPGDSTTSTDCPMCLVTSAPAPVCKAQNDQTAGSKPMACVCRPLPPWTSHPTLQSPSRLKPSSSATLNESLPVLVNASHRHLSSFQRNH